ncbi:hypothetical protein PENTCL1PPCAC_1188, partial [Pristionchus entomophagus]
QSDNSHASVKRRPRKKGDSTPNAGVSNRSRKVRKVDKSTRAKKSGANTPVRTPARSPIESTDVNTDEKEKRPKTAKRLQKADPEVLKAIKDGRESFVHVVRRGTRINNQLSVFLPGRIYKPGTDPKAVPIVPTTKMKDEMKGIVSEPKKKKTKERKYLAERTSKSSTSDTGNVDKSNASRKKSR